ncbi:response regulator [Rhizobacter sp. Root404]|jgi:CheY-like chemotaxis protein|uniref:response regulator n=1 Tax=Rhizobacter sp. Root404 TaxID=1736528 RepID=UPI0009EBDC76
MAGRAAPLRILYVEDNDDLRETIGMLLESDVREVTTVPNAEAALATWQPGRFDVLVTDVSLPGMSGTALAREVLALDRQQWVVLCSGYGFGQELGTLGTNVRSLPKPFELDELDALMDEIVAAMRR